MVGLPRMVSYAEMWWTEKPLDGTDGRARGCTSKANFVLSRYHLCFTKLIASLFFEKLFRERCSGGPEFLGWSELDGIGWYWWDWVPQLDFSMSPWMLQCWWMGVVSLGKDHEKKEGDGLIDLKSLARFFWIDPIHLIRAGRQKKPGWPCRHIDMFCFSAWRPRIELWRNNLWGQSRLMSEINELGLDLWDSWLHFPKHHPWLRPIKVLPGALDEKADLVYSLEDLGGTGATTCVLIQASWWYEHPFKPPMLKIQYVAGHEMPKPSKAMGNRKSDTLLVLNLFLNSDRSSESQEFQTKN